MFASQLRGNAHKREEIRRNQAFVESIGVDDGEQRVPEEVIVAFDRIFRPARSQLLKQECLPELCLGSFDGSPSDGGVRTPALETERAERPQLPLGGHRLFERHASRSIPG